jgi:hypothetical protein
MRRHATGLLVPVQLLTPISCMVAPGRAAEGTEVLAGGWGGGGEEAVSISKGHFTNAHAVTVKPSGDSGPKWAPGVSSPILLWLWKLFWGRPLASCQPHSFCGVPSPLTPLLLSCVLLGLCGYHVSVCTLLGLEVLGEPLRAEQHQHQ